MGEGAPFLGPWRGRRGLAESGGDESVQERVWSRLEDGPTSSREWGTWRASRPDRVPLCVFPWPRAASWTPKLRKLGAVRGQLDVWRVVRLCDVGGPLVCFWPYTRRLQGAPFGQSPPTRRGRTDFSKRPFSRASVRPAERPAGNAEGRPTEPSMRPECDPNARRRAWCDNGGPVLARASRRGGLWRRFERHDPPRADAAARRPSAPGRLLCARAAAPGRRRRHLVQRRPRRRRRRRCGAGAPGFHHRRLARRRPRRGAEQPGRPRAPQAQPGPGFGALWRSPGQGAAPLPAVLQRRAAGVQGRQPARQLFHGGKVAGVAPGAFRLCGAVEDADAPVFWGVVSVRFPGFAPFQPRSRRARRAAPGLCT
mmetsp:Transcript_19202/g.66151  ORF Transcript_19202/g.66151 Transcript_19202/m.66151 type:complete len:368 (+) Transcript_19202:2090-3193(+)